MSLADRSPGRHPLCTCPELTWAILDGRQPPLDTSQCRGGAIAHPPPLDIDQVRELLAEYVVALTHEGYGTGMHYPDCRNRQRCTGCVEPLPSWITDGPQPAYGPDSFGLRR